MKVGIGLKIDVTKIERSRIFEGEKGKYVDLQAFVDLDEKDKYDNNGFISHSPTKEERESKAKTPICGNVRVFWREDGVPADLRPKEPAPTGYPEANSSINDDIPF